MRRSLDERILSDIDTLLTKLNQKCEQMILAQFWLLSLKDDIKEKPKVTPGVI